MNTCKKYWTKMLNFEPSKYRFWDKKTYTATLTDNNGVTRCITPFAKGKTPYICGPRDGIEKYWNARGELYKEVKYDNGKIINVVNYDEIDENADVPGAKGF